MISTKTSRRHRAMFGMALCMVAAPAVAQDAQEAQDQQRGTVENPNEVLARPRPGYDPVGIKAGSVIILPYVDVQALYDDNVFASDTYKKSDASALVTAGASAHTDWAVNSLSADGYVAAERFAHLTRQNNERADVNVKGRLDVRRTVSVDATARFARLMEDRGSQGDAFIGGSTPMYQVKSGAGGISLNPGRFALRVEGGVADYTYDAITFNNQKFTQHYRNNDETTAGARLSYSLSPSITTFVSGGYTGVSYHNRETDFDLNSKNYSGLVGANFKITRLVVGEVGIGWIKQSFADPRFHDSSGLAYDARVVWNPTTLIAVTLSGRSTVEQSAIVGVAGVLRRDGTLGVDYEFMRNVIVHAEGSVVGRKYNGLDGGADRSDKLYGGQVGVKYLLNRTVNVGLTYAHTGQRSSGDGAREYDANRVALVLRFQR